MHSLSKALDYSFPLVVRLKPLFRKRSWPRGCVVVRFVRCYSGSFGFDPREEHCSALKLIVLWLKPNLIVHFDTFRIWDYKFVQYLNWNAYFGSGKFFNIRIFGLFPITLSIFSHLFNSQWRSGCVLDFHSNILSSIPSIIIFFKILSACTVFQKHWIILFS